MFNVCHHCGLYRADKIIDSSGPYAICPECGHKHLFRQLPLLMVSGASGAGKSSACNALTGQMEEAVLLDSDILWRPEYNTPEDHYREFFKVTLRLAKNISQSGRPVVWLGAGMGVPDNIEPCVERRYFSTVHYLALVCDDEVLAQRLKARPAWRGCSEPGFIENHIRFNHWFKAAPENGLPISLIDTTGVPLEQTIDQVRAWIRDRSKTHS